MTPALQGLTVWTTHFFTQFTENALFKKTDFDFLKVRLDICFQGPEIEQFSNNNNNTKNNNNAKDNKQSNNQNPRNQDIYDFFK